jgi:putative ABC transport system permease protein
MLKNYFKLAWRNLIKDRQFTFLNLVGLSTGLACALLIWLWVADEKSVDKYNEKDSRLFQVMSNNKTENGIKTGDYTPGILAKALKDEIPEIEYAVPVLSASWFPYQATFGEGGKYMKAGGSFVGKDYFDVFTVPFITGDKKALFRDKTSIAISSRLALKFFGTTEGLLGKTIKWDLQEFTGDYTIIGVFKENPINATEQFDALLNYDLVPEKRPGLLSWDNSDPNTYIIVKPGTAVARLNNKIRNFIHGKSDGNKTTLSLVHFSDKYLRGNFENGVQTGGRIAYVRLFSIIAVFILIVACINFMNLSTAKAARRTKEVGIKKVVGAGRGSLILQYLSESLLMTFSSLFIAVLLMQLLLPAFNSITGKQLTLLFDTRIVLSVLGIAILTGFVAGSYPAFFLSAFKPSVVLKGTHKHSIGELWIRKGLVIFQFALSAIFIASVLIIYRQVNFIQSKNLGYERDHLIHFEIPLGMDSAKLKATETFVRELNNIPGVVNASSYYHTLMGDHGSISGLEWPAKDPSANIEFANLEVGYNFLETAGIKLRQGRGFSANPNSRHEIVFNEMAIRAMGLKDPIGKTVKFWGEEKEIVGVAADFNFESLYTQVKPCFFQVYPVMPNVLVKIKTGNEKQTIAMIGKAFTDFNKGLAFDYRFLDQDYQALYISETRIGIMSRYFAGLAIIISCLGLFGLAAFSAQRRQKEIGIRKIVGASVTSVALLLSREFLILVGIAILVAFPLVWWTMNDWLSGFAYRVTIGVDIFVITAAAAMLITILTISFQSVKAALSNPVKSLRSE